MKLPVPFIQLPLRFDAKALEAEIAALGEDVWRPHPEGYPGNDALSLVSVDGDSANDAVRGPMRPTAELQACPYLMQVMHSIGAVWGRSRLMRLSGQAEVRMHVDLNYYWREHMRVHVPIVTQPTVRFTCGEATINMAAGECWIFDTWRLHRVLNDDHRQRIHLVADTIGGKGMRQLMNQGRPHDHQPVDWQLLDVPPANTRVELDYESYNLPRVMTPWEVRAHFSFLLAETVPGAALRELAHQVMWPFASAWHALWAKYGDSGDGFTEYAALRDELFAGLRRFEALTLQNGVPLIRAINAIVTGNLLAPV